MAKIRIILWLLLSQEAFLPPSPALGAPCTTPAQNSAHEELLYTGTSEHTYHNIRTKSTEVLSHFFSDFTPLCWREWCFAERLQGLFSLPSLCVCRLKQTDDPANSLQIPVTLQDISRFSICLPQLPCKPNSSLVKI